ncbi:hypothetical protein A0J48_004945 [Sphaerospermopsis aphanizomenoides BCCUSP55]|uniref:hypothetical protein n=1 Tax=Sphaerospermopsis aphanizomenoides TaxID=459663 RepID=UPI001906B0D2|nr:hypothetical protein [Sphaerospermopsis aphanizomenoides]MBK1986895.1 hypothetical protein [Sphaerospermopsis aphanizomenoides BCCUSP55]
MKTELGKGEIAEEVLRSYFIEHGYFVVRSLPFAYNQIDITDVDLWLYEKASPFTRERTNVDIKNRSNPQAFERIIWAKGLQATLKLERAMVATTSTRKEARDFGLANEVIVLEGNFLNNLIQKGISLNRITEEIFLLDIEKESYGKGKDDWKGRYKASKGRLLSKLNFDGCNEYLREINYFLEQSLLRVDQNLTPLRLFYVNIAFLLICIDFMIKNHICLDQKTRMEFLANGFNYGERGKERTDSITNAAIKLASSVIANPSIPRTLQMEVNKQIKGRPVEILADFFSRDSSINSLFEIAKLFECFSYSQVISPPSKLPVELQSIIALIADFFHIDRKRILSI